MAKNRVTAAALLFLALASIPAEATAQGCMSGRDGRELLEQGEVIPFPEAVRRAGISPDQLVGVPDLCQGGGGFVYRVRVLQPGGTVRSMNIPAS